VIDPATGEVLAEFPGVYGLWPTDDPNVVYQINDEPTIVATYDVARDARVARVDTGLYFDSWSPLGNLIAVGGDVGQYVPMVKVRIVDFEGEPRLGPLIDGSGKFEIISFALDTRGLLLAVSLDGGTEFQIQRHDASTGEIVGEPAIGYRGFSSTPGGIVFATSDGRLLNVDPATLKPIGFPFGQIDPDEWVLLDDQGRRLAVGGGTIEPGEGGRNWLALYDVESRAQLGTQIDVGDLDVPAPGLAFRSDGLELAVDTERGIVVWDLDPTHWVDAACDVAGRNLTQAEWDQYIGDLAPYRATCPQFAAA
jgi:hypothetical protein